MTIVPKAPNVLPRAPKADPRTPVIDSAIRDPNEAIPLSLFWCKCPDDGTTEEKSRYGYRID